jgi:hypothetical protein
MNKIEEFAEQIKDWAITYKGQFGYSQNTEKLRGVLDKALRIGGFASEVAKTILETLNVGDTVARVSYKQALCIARSVHNYKEETYTVTFRFDNGGIKTAHHCDKEQLDKLLERGAVIEYQKN